MNQIKNRIKGGLYGLIVGDALGVPYEFRTKEEMKSEPCIDMIGYGTYNLPKGIWSDGVFPHTTSVNIIYHV